jgi:hypothetical protein
MSYTTLPIVGAFYRPPAKTLLAALAIGTPLFLMAEPTNEFDANAVAVFLESQNIPEAAHEMLSQELPNFGFDLDTILSQDQWHLGYIPKQFASALRASETIMPNAPFDVEFAISGDGSPRVRFAEPVL